MNRAFRQLGLVVHPTRPVDNALRDIREWAAAHDVAVGQVPAEGNSRQVADRVAAESCELLLAVGGDGTTLAALHSGAEHSRPVLGVACGSLGVLTSVTAERVGWALGEFAAGRWTPVPVPALDLTWEDSTRAMAINDVAVIRDSPGQIIVSIAVDDVLYARVAGDGLVVATALGSTAYTMAAGGPILAPGAEGMTVTPLASHGGAVAPLVAGRASRLSVAVEAGRVGVRYEVDGRGTSITGANLTVEMRPDYATAVSLEEDEPRLTGLRRRGLVLDSPRVLARDARL
jgi:NAD+ kinase